MELFDYLMAKKSHNSSIHGDLFSYLLGKKSSTSGVYTTYTGQTFNIANTVRAKIKNWILGGNTEQNIEPTPDNPQQIHIVKGNNSINITNKNIIELNSFTENTDYILNSDNSITVTKNYGSSGRIFTNSINLKAGTYTFSYIPNLTGNLSERFSIANLTTSTNIVNQNLTIINDQKTIYTFTLNDSAEIAFCLMPNQATSGTLTLEELMLEQGSTATKYEKYQIQNYPINLGNIELCKIGDYQDEIKASDGTNLFNKNNANILVAYFASPANKITISQNAKMFYISCKPNTTYTISKIQSERFRVMTTETTPEIGVVGIDYAQNETGTRITISTSSNAHYLCVYYFLNGTDTLTEQEILNSIQVEYGSQVTEYQPFGKNTWYIKKNINKVILNGTESGFDTGGAGQTTYRTYLEDTTVAFNTTDEIKVLCNYLNGNTPDEIITNLQVGISTRRGTAQGFFMRVPITIANDLTSFLQWLSEVNPIVYYVLATPTYTVITDTNLINQLNALLNSRSYNDLTNIEQINKDLPFNISLDIKVTSANLGMNNSLNNSFLSNNIQEEQNLDDVNEIEDIEQNDEPIENEETE